MKKIAAFLLCLSLLSAGSLTAFADEEPGTAPGEALIGTQVPDSHKITITVTGDADVSVNGQEGPEVEVERLSEPELEFKAKEGEKIKKVTLNGEDITDKLIDGKLTLDPIYEDKSFDIQVETEPLPADDPSGSDNDTLNPKTGMIGTASVALLIAFGAMTMTKRKNKDEE